MAEWNGELLSVYKSSDVNGNVDLVETKRWTLLVFHEVHY